MSVLRGLTDVLQGRRSPHWFYLALLSLSAAVGLHVYLRGVSVPEIPVSTATIVSIGLPLILFLSLYAILLAYFNARAINADYPIVIHNGEFKYEQQLHIALRVETLKNLIRSMTERMRSQDDSKRILFESGAFTGADFGKKFPTLYLKEMKRGDGEVDWSKLQLREKLDLWCEWDKGVGWGIFQTIVENDGSLRVENRHATLYTGDAGPLIAQFMAGYISGVVEEIKGEKVRLISGPTIGAEHSNIVMVLGR